MTSFEQTLRLAGLRPRDVVADGMWRRCATDDKPTKRNGVYVLFPWGVGYFRNRAVDGTDNHKWEDGTKIDHAPSAAHLERMRRQSQQERAARVAAIRAARQFWNVKAKPVRQLHPYLFNKGLGALGTAGLRVADGRLIVPVMFRSSLISVQSIAEDGAKRFWPGAPVKAGHYVIERPGAAVTVLCEGFATGLAVYQCMRHARVVVCFDAGNLQPVANELRPTGSVVFAADNDHGTLARRGFNPGLEKARNAADLIGAGVAWPQGITGTDFCDMKKEIGAGADRRIERLILAAARYVVSK